MANLTIIWARHYHTFHGPSPRVPYLCTTSYSSSAHASKISRQCVRYEYVDDGAVNLMHRVYSSTIELKTSKALSGSFVKHVPQMITIYYVVNNAAAAVKVLTSKGRCACHYFGCVCLFDNGHVRVILIGLNMISTAIRTTFLFEFFINSAIFNIVPWAMNSTRCFTMFLVFWIEYLLFWNWAVFMFLFYNLCEEFHGVKYAFPHIHYYQQQSAEMWKQSTNFYLHT